MRPILGLSFVLLGACSNACPSPAPLCSEPHPSYCPCMIVDSGSTPAPDAFVPPVDAAAGDDTGAMDAGSTDDTGAGTDTGATDDAATASDAGDDAGMDAHHP